MKIRSFDDLYVDQLRDLYSAENQIIKALPKMIKSTSSQELKHAFQEHLEQTRGHAERLEQIFDELDVSSKGPKCKGMTGVLEEGEDLLSDVADPAILDAALIAAAQRVEHYEMAGYGCARTYAHMLGRDRDANLLQQTLGEEKDTDEKLTQLAERAINIHAVEASHGRV
jgi:ferritin-like metal-binding protein YciE